MPAIKNRHGQTLVSDPSKPRTQLAGAGASGIHANQNNRHHKVGRTSRVATRGAQLRAVLRHEG
jgi:hypothetical protein